jgi:PQQ-dependent catabolism-associated CXXCW motif protein
MSADVALQRLGLLLALILASAAGPATVPEPAGFWTGPPTGPVPATLKGGHVIDAKALDGLRRHTAAVLIDVSPAPPRPAGQAADTKPPPPSHKAVPGSVWLAGMGLGRLTAKQDAWFKARLAELTFGKRDTPLVFYCHPRCWAGWNAAKRAIGYGYREVNWFPDGIEGWVMAGFPAAEAMAILPP